MMLWLEFLGVSAVILFSGSRLTRYGDIISEKSGLSRLWLGLALMAGVTSLPELATGLSAVASNLPDIAAGNILGSCVFNVFILGFLDTLSRKVPLSSRINQANILSAGMSVLFLGGVALSLFLGDRLPGLAVAGLIYNSEKKRFLWAWDSPSASSSFSRSTSSCCSCCTDERGRYPAKDGTEIR